MLVLPLHRFQSHTLNPLRNRKTTPTRAVNGKTFLPIHTEKDSPTLWHTFLVVGVWVSGGVAKEEEDGVWKIVHEKKKGNCLVRRISYLAPWKP
jgi:hypothetical protein